MRRFHYYFFADFVFIHINKTGGSSIEKALKLPFEHKTALETIDHLGWERWNKRFSFTVIRNPFDKVLSHYTYRVETNQTELGNRTISFRDWVRLTYGEQDATYYDKPKFFMPQHDWISDESGNILVDKIYRFESLNDDFRRICENLGRTATLPHVKASKRGDYRDYYDTDTIDIISDWFKKDLDCFNYSY